MTQEFVVSGDSHVVEPMDLFTERLPKNLRDKALTQTSPNQMAPPSASSSSPSTLSSVLLPEPEAPAMTVSDPASTRSPRPPRTGMGSEGPR